MKKNNSIALDKLFLI